MLLQLNIKNFALIESLSISFDKGFNVFSGETGAGKSILIDAINYVLGSKFNKDFIRTGENKTFVEAVFTIENEKTMSILNELGIEYEDMIIIERETFQSGKSIIKVNGRSMLVSNLKKLTSNLLDIHGQHENQNMLDSSNHIHYLDYFGEDSIKCELDKYTITYKSMNDVKTKINELSGTQGDNEKLVDFIKYQIDEIKSAKLIVGEEENLQSQISILTNSEKIGSILNNSYSILYEGTNEATSVFDTLGTVIRDIKTIEGTHETLKNISEELQNIYYSLEGAIEEIRSFKEDIYYDENELEQMNSRLFQISGLKKKYGKSIKEILEYLDKASIQYDELVNRTEIIEKLKNQEKELQEILNKQAQVIHKIRCDSAALLEKRIKNELNYIGLEKSIFKIEIAATDKFTPIGFDKVQFMISTNPGEPPKPLEKVVSGGELSRIMLALKTVFVDKDNISTVIFDEIDTGISGRIAQSVSEKMYIVSVNRQVFCVTHLPQIAAMSDTHYCITKEVEGGKTYTKVTLLDKPGKEAEIAKMTGGAKVTNTTLENARELIYLANIKKNGLMEKL
ncbi:MAG: DNA repair protein RecN [Solirubrobacterales bacterium]